MLLYIFHYLFIIIDIVINSIIIIIIIILSTDKVNFNNVYIDFKVCDHMTLML